MRKGWKNDIARRFEYKGCVYHAGVINGTALTSYFTILRKTLWINKNGRNTYRIYSFRSCYIESVARECGSAFQEKYFAVSLHNLEANRSIIGIPIFWQICWNQSTLVFRIRERYPVVIGICLNGRFFQMPLLISTPLVCCTFQFQLFSLLWRLKWHSSQVGVLGYHMQFSLLYWLFSSSFHTHAAVSRNLQWNIFLHKRLSEAWPE